MKRLYNAHLVLGVFILLSCSVKNTEVETNDLSKTPRGMVLIPSGTFTMGGKSDQADADEFPRHEVSITSFYMDEAEVTNAQFATFVEETGYVTIAERDIDWSELSKDLPPDTPKPADSVLKAGSLVFRPTEGPVDMRDYSQWWEWKVGANWKYPEGPDSNIEQKMNHPVVHVAWDDAKAYAEWAGKRLPTEAEWEWAAMGGLNDSKYPWGNTSAEKAYDKANFWQGFFPYQNLEKDGFLNSAPIKSFPPNGYGLYDMAGNVWEWCLDKYHHNAYKERAVEGVLSNPQGPHNSFDPAEPYVEKYSIRGGSFLCNDSYCSGYRVSRRMRSSKDSGMNHTGFRCVKDI
ncbi:MAG: formylglycine-generating enzyme family protein [Bacteroidota bacterium]